MMIVIDNDDVDENEDYHDVCFNAKLHHLWFQHRLKSYMTSHSQVLSDKLTKPPLDIGSSRWGVSACCEEFATQMMEGLRRGFTTIYQVCIDAWFT